MALPITRPTANLRPDAHRVEMAARDVSAKLTLSIPVIFGAQRVSAFLPRTRKAPVSGGFLEADDGVRTRDPQLGKLMLYQLSYVRVR
jgi:hypothetical protein